MVGQRLVQRADDERAITHSRRHSFRRATSHVPDGEDFRSCRLQEQRLATAAFSMLGEARVTPCVFAGDDEPLLVEADQTGRSEEHTSELQSRQYLVCRLLLAK